MFAGSCKCYNRADDLPDGPYIQLIIPQIYLITGISVLTVSTAHYRVVRLYACNARTLTQLYYLARHAEQAWLPDGYSQIFKIACVWPFGLLDYGSATLRCKI